MSDTRDKLAAALAPHGAFESVSDGFRCHCGTVTLNPDAHLADALLASDVLRDMLTEAEARGRAAVDHSCCRHCAEDPVHDVPKNRHDLPCDICVKETAAYERGRAEVTAAVEAAFGDLTRRYVDTRNDPDIKRGADQIAVYSAQDVRNTLDVALADRGALNRVKAETLREAVEEYAITIPDALGYKVRAVAAEDLLDRADRGAQDGGN